MTTTRRHAPTFRFIVHRSSFIVSGLALATLGFLGATILAAPTTSTAPASPPTQSSVLSTQHSPPPPATATAPATRPAPPTPSTLPTPAFALRSIADLKSLQSQVETVAKKAVPATVAILIGNAQGSGVIVSKDGYVLTAGHVAATPDRTCILILADGRRVRAKTLGVDSGMDAGLIKITDPPPAGEAVGFPFLHLGKSAALKPGDWVIALGHPGGYHREPDGTGRPPLLRLGRVLFSTERLLASDCTIIMGDSGGPLLNLAGDVVGIHSRIGPATVANIHIPVDTYPQTWDRLARGDAWGSPLSRTPPSLPTPPGGALLGLLAGDDLRGARVEGLTPDMPAIKAGLKIGDIITMIDGQPIAGAQPLVDLLARRKPNEEVKLTILREDNDKPLELTAKLAPKK